MVMVIRAVAPVIDGYRQSMHQFVFILWYPLIFAFESPLRSPGADQGSSDSLAFTIACVILEQAGISGDWPSPHAQQSASLNLHSSLSLMSFFAARGVNNPILHTGRY